MREERREEKGSDVSGALLLRSRLLRLCGQPVSANQHSKSVTRQKGRKGQRIENG